jgi:hypothetical protein
MHMRDSVVPRAGADGEGFASLAVGKHPNSSIETGYRSKARCDLTVTKFAEVRLWGRDP